MTSERTASAYARARQASTAAIEGAQRLRQAADQWMERPQPTTPAELHEVTRGLTLSLGEAERVAAALAYEWRQSADPQGAAEARVAAEHLHEAVGHLTRLGVIGLEAQAGLEEWPDQPQAHR